MLRTGLAALAAVAMAVGAAQAQTPPQDPPEGLVWMALRDINEAYFDPDDPMNRPPLETAVPDGMIRAVEINGDGRPDWLVDYSVDGPNGYCGTGGCTRKLYVSGVDGYRRAFDSQAHELTIYQAGGETRLEAWVHHTFCNAHVEECRYAWAWDEAAGRLVERPNRAGDGLLRDLGVPPIDDGGDENASPAAPQAVASLWFTTRRTCPATNDDGFETRRANIRDVPDLNGDGVRDWIVTPPYDCEEQAGDPAPMPGFQVWLSDGQGGATEAYVSPVDRYPSIDVGVSPAVLVTNPPCGFGEPCPDERLRWDGRSFVTE
jgi:hypothetical protein